MKFALSTLLVLGLGSDLHAQSCFQRDDNKNLKFKVLQLAPPPVIDSSTHDYPKTLALYPATDFVTSNIQSLNSTSTAVDSGVSFAKSYLLQVNGCLFMPGLTPRAEACRNTAMLAGNSYPGQEGTTLTAAFSSLERANSCTRLQALRVLGGDTGKIENQAKEAGLKLWDNRDHKALSKQAQSVSLTAGKSGTYLVDVCALEEMSQAPDAAGLVLNYNVLDQRTPEQTNDFLRQIGNTTRPYGKKLVPLSPELGSTKAEASGITTVNLRGVLFSVDGLILTLGSLTWPSYKTQNLALKKLKLEPELAAKLMWSLDATKLALDDAEKLHKAIVEQHGAGILLLHPSPQCEVMKCLIEGQCKNAN